MELALISRSKVAIYKNPEIVSSGVKIFILINYIIKQLFGDKYDFMGA